MYKCFDCFQPRWTKMCSRIKAALIYTPLMIPPPNSAANRLLSSVMFVIWTWSLLLHQSRVKPPPPSHLYVSLTCMRKRGGKQWLQIYRWLSLPPPHLVQLKEGVEQKKTKTPLEIWLNVAFKDHFPDFNYFISHVLYRRRQEKQKKTKLVKREQTGGGASLRLRQAVWSSWDDGGYGPWGK